MKDNDIIEKLAAYEHNRWSRWQKHLFSKCIINQDGSLTIPKEFVEVIKGENLWQPGIQEVLGALH